MFKMFCFTVRNKRELDYTVDGRREKLRTRSEKDTEQAKSKKVNQIKNLHEGTKNKLTKNKMLTDREKVRKFQEKE